MKVALVSEEFPPYTFGGIASACRDLAFSLAKKGVETTVLCGSSRPSFIECPQENLKIVRLPLLGLPPRFLWFQIENCSRLLRTLGEVDIFHAVNPLSAAVPISLGMKLGAPCVVSIHGSYRGNLSTLLKGPFRYWTAGEIATHLLEYPLKELLCKLFRSGAHHFMMCSVSTLREFHASYPGVPVEKSTVAYNGIDFGTVRQLEKQKSTDKPSADHSVVFYGRLCWQKGIIHLIKSFDILRRTIQDAVLDIYGEGPMESAIRTLVSRLGLEEAVRLNGMIPRSELMARVRNYDVVALPSLYEGGQPMAALEAMALRKPVVVFDSPYSREFIVNMSNGVMARTLDIPDLSQKIEMLLTDASLARRMGQRARKYVEQYHNWDSLVKKYIGVYESLVGESS